MFQTSHGSRGLAAAGLATLALVAGVFAAPPPASAAAAPPPVANVRATGVYDHTIVLTFDVPAAYYDPGAGGVVTMTIGRTPAATPSAGYPQRVIGRTVTTVRYLKPSTAYTFAIWVRDHGVLSARRALTVTTKRDTTAPGPVTSLRAEPILSQALRPGAWLRWGNPSDTAHDQSVRIYRTTTSWAGGTLVTPGRTDIAYIDRDPALRRDVTYHYYLAEHDASGNYAPYVRVDVTTNLRRVGGNSNGWVDVFDADGHGLPTPQDQSPEVAGTRFAESGDGYAVNVVAGRVTVCSYAPPPDPPDSHMQLISACWAPDATNPHNETIYDWNEDTASFPPESEGALDLRTTDRAQFTDLELVYS